MKPCPYCGKGLPSEMLFCPYCMHKLIEEQAVGGAPAKRSHIPLWIGGGVALFLLCGALLWWALTPPGQAGDTSTPAQESAPFSQTEQADTEMPPQKPEGTSDSGADGATSTTRANHGDTQTPSSGTPVGGSTTSTTSIASATTTTGSLSPCDRGEHDWVAVTKKVQHPAVKHEETVIVGYRDVTYYKCAVCYEDFDSLDDYYAHFEEHLATSDSLVAIFRDRYETPTRKEPIYQKQWVVDTPAYEETVITGYTCRHCGATK